MITLASLGGLRIFFMDFAQLGEFRCERKLQLLLNLVFLILFGDFFIERSVVEKVLLWEQFLWEEGVLLRGGFAEDVAEEFVVLGIVFEPIYGVEVHYKFSNLLIIFL